MTDVKFDLKEFFHQCRRSLLTSFLPLTFSSTVIDNYLVNGELYLVKAALVFLKLTHTYYDRLSKFEI